jgi:hypothetical protein
MPHRDRAAHRARRRQPGRPRRRGPPRGRSARSTARDARARGRRPLACRQRRRPARARPSRPRASCASRASARACARRRAPARAELSRSRPSAPRSRGTPWRHRSSGEPRATMPLRRDPRRVPPARGGGGRRGAPAARPCRSVALDGSSTRPETSPVACASGPDRPRFGGQTACAGRLHFRSCHPARPASREWRAADAHAASRCAGPSSWSASSPCSRS